MLTKVIKARKTPVELVNTFEEALGIGRAYLADDPPWKLGKHRFTSRWREVEVDWDTWWAYLDGLKFRVDPEEFPLYRRMIHELAAADFDIWYAINENRIFVREQAILRASKKFFVGEKRLFGVYEGRKGDLGGFKKKTNP